MCYVSTNFSISMLWFLFRFVVDYENSDRKARKIDLQRFKLKCYFPKQKSQSERQKLRNKL